MTEKLCVYLVWIGMVASVGGLRAEWSPPSKLSRQEIIAVSRTVLAAPEIAIKEYEDISRIRALGLDWDIGAAVYEPEDPARVPRAPGGAKAGLFLLHGGSGDHRSQTKIARFLAAKYGFKVVTMSYPGRLYLPDPSRDWPGDTIHPDGTVRTPIWKRGERITADQYEVVRDRDEARRRRWGTLILACAKPGTDFYDRMAGWPVAFEEGAKSLMRRHFPAGEYFVYIHGHSTGGPFANILSQRVENIAGVLGMESANFGYLWQRRSEARWELPFNCLRVRNWRDTARYAGPEALAHEGPQALLQLPLLMERVFETWERGTKSPQFKAENIIHFGATDALRKAARATAARLDMSQEETQALVKRFTGYTHELRGGGTRPMPPLLLGIAKDSKAYTREVYETMVLPAYAAMQPAPKVRLVRYDAGVHNYTKAETGLPMGLFPAVAQLWRDAIIGGFFRSP